jgi:hypothetical protein
MALHYHYIITLNFRQYGVALVASKYVCKSYEEKSQLSVIQTNLQAQMAIFISRLCNDPSPTTGVKI